MGIVTVNLSNLDCQSSTPEQRGNAVRMPHSRALRESADLRHLTLPPDDCAIDWANWPSLAAVVGADTRRGPILISSLRVLVPDLAGRQPARRRCACRQLVVRRVAYYALYPPRALERRTVRAFRDWLVKEAGGTTAKEPDRFEPVRA